MRTQQTPRAVLANHGRLLVRRVMDRDDEVSDALFDIAADGRTDWTLADWRQLLRELKASRLTVSQWLTERENEK